MDPCDPSAALVYATHESLDRRYGRPIRALARKYAPRPWSNRWIGEEDFVSEAWEAAYRIKGRYGHLVEPHFGNVLVRGVRNALINARKRMDRELNRTVSLDDSWPDHRDSHGELALRVALEQVARRLPVGQRQLLARMLEPSPAVLERGHGRVTAALSCVIGRCPETAREYVKKIRRVVRRKVLDEL